MAEEACTLSGSTCVRLPLSIDPTGEAEIAPESIEHAERSKYTEAWE